HHAVSRLGQWCHPEPHSPSETQVRPRRYRRQMLESNSVLYRFSLGGPMLDISRDIHSLTDFKKKTSVGWAATSPGFGGWIGSSSTASSGADRQSLMR